MEDETLQAATLRSLRYRLAFLLRDLHMFLLLGLAGVIGLNGNLWLAKRDGVMEGHYLEPIPVSWRLLWALLVVVLLISPAVVRLPSAICLGRPSLAFRGRDFLRTAKAHGWRTGLDRRNLVNKRLSGYTALMVVSWAGAFLVPWTALRLILLVAFALTVHLLWKHSTYARQERMLDSEFRRVPTPE